MLRALLLFESASLVSFFDTKKLSVLVKFHLLRNCILYRILYLKAYFMVAYLITNIYVIFKCGECIRTNTSVCGCKR